MIKNPIKEATFGLTAFTRGLAWYRQNPKYLFLVFLPIVLGVVCAFFGTALFFSYDDVLIDMILFAEPSAWWAIALYYLCKALVYVSFLVAVLVGSVLVVNIIASPIYDIVSMKVESDITGKASPELSIVESLKLIGEELKKVAFISVISLALLVIPGINLFAMLATALLVAWDFYDFPFARRGMKFKDRIVFLKQDLWAIFGMGLWMMIPFIQFVMMPLAVAGGTMIAVRRIESLEEGHPSLQRT